LAGNNASMSRWMILAGAERAERARVPGDARPAELRQPAVVDHAAAPLQRPAEIRQPDAAGTFEPAADPRALHRRPGSRAQNQDRHVEDPFQGSHPIRAHPPR